MVSFLTSACTCLASHRLPWAGTRGGFAGRTSGYPSTRRTRGRRCARHGAELRTNELKSHAAAGAEGQALPSRVLPCWTAYPPVKRSPSYENTTDARRSRRRGSADTSSDSTAPDSDPQRDPRPVSKKQSRLAPDQQVPPKQQSADAHVGKHRRSLFSDLAGVQPRVSDRHLRVMRIVPELGVAAIPGQR